MPVDIKIVRSDPLVVKSWQEARGRPASVVDDVRDADAACRKALKNLNEARARLKTIKQLARRQERPKEKSCEAVGADYPQKANSISDISTGHGSVGASGHVSRRTTNSRYHLDASKDVLISNCDDLKALIKETQSKIGHLERVWLHASALVNERIQILTSQVDPKMSSQYAHELWQRLKAQADDRSSSKGKCSHSPVSSVSSALIALAAKYNIVLTASSQDPQIVTFPTRQVSCDVAHAAWGCPVRGQDVLSLGSPVSAPDTPHSDGPVMNNKNRTLSSIPTWLDYVARHFKKKTILGHTQLPRFLCFWNTTSVVATPPATRMPLSIQIVAMTAGTMSDSRGIQELMLAELFEFIASVTETGTSVSPSDICVRCESPSHLEQHEISRIYVESRDGSCKIAEISNFGDAASRAINIQFAGGGPDGRVHFVVSTLYMSSIREIIDDNPLVAVGSSDDYDGLKFWDEKKGSGFAQARSSSSGVRRSDDLSLASPVENKLRAKQEALTCPFDFIF